VAHINKICGPPGITGLMIERPDTAAPLNQLAETLLRGPMSLSRGERELIAAYEKDVDNCNFCSNAHSAFAAAQLEGGMPFVLQARTDPALAPITPKLRALLAIAAAVRESGLKVTPEHIEAARTEGATDLEIHDTVLIAAAVSMFNRYVDGLATLTPESPDAYLHGVNRIVRDGYLAPRNP